MVKCPYCGSEDVVRITVGYGFTAISTFCIAGTLMFFGFFFPPLLIVAAIVFIVSLIAFFLKITTSVKDKLTNNTKIKDKWKCKRCHRPFLLLLEKKQG